MEYMMESLSFMFICSLTHLFKNIYVHLMYVTHLSIVRKRLCWTFIRIQELLQVVVLNFVYIE